MKIVPYSKVRESFTEIAQNVQFYKEPCVFEKNNKPLSRTAEPVSKNETRSHLN